MRMIAAGARLVLSLLCLLSVAAAGCRHSWRTVAPPGEGFSVSMPGEPTKITENAETVIGPVEFRVWFVSFTERSFGLMLGDYLVQSAEMPKTADWEAVVADAEAMLFTGASPGSSVKRREVTQGACRGREIEAEVAEGMFVKARTYYCGGRLFQVMTTGPEAIVHSLDRGERFLDSFSLTF